MSSILYYSKFCEHSNKLLQTLSKAGSQKDIHFICIDKRVKEANNKVFIVLENGQKIIMPENVNRVPALLLLNENYQVLYGEAILNHLKPKQEVAVKKATQNNMEPMAFSFGGGGFGDIVSDAYSFLDQGSEELQAKGNGGTRQMHNYVDLNYSDNITTPSDDHDYKGSNKISGELTIEQLQQQRDSELQKITGGNKPPIKF
jgi:uncharacterized protein YukJ